MTKKDDRNLKATLRWLRKATSALHPNIHLWREGSHIMLVCTDGFRLHRARLSQATLDLPDGLYTDAMVKVGKPDRHFVETVGSYKLPPAPLYKIKLGDICNGKVDGLVLSHVMDLLINCGYLINVAYLTDAMRMAAEVAYASRKDHGIHHVYLADADGTHEAVIMPIAVRGARESFVDEVD